MTTSPHPPESHPVERALLAAIANPRANTLVESLILEFGRPFTGVDLPPAYIRGPARSCFENAGRAALNGHGTYVEGFVIAAGADFAFQHAWLTSDGINAIDLTLPDPKRCDYFGVAFPPEVFEDALSGREKWGLLDATYALTRMRVVLARCTTNPTLPSTSGVP